MQGNQLYSQKCRSLISPDDTTKGNSPVYALFCGSFWWPGGGKIRDREWTNRDRKVTRERREKRGGRMKWEIVDGNKGGGNRHDNDERSDVKKRK